MTVDQQFAALQETLRPFESVEDPNRAAPRTVVVIPSINVDAALLDLHRGEIAALEERWLYLLFALRRPFARVVFVSSMPVADAVLDQYLSLMPGVPDARQRLELVSAADDSARPLAAKLLERPQLLRRIANLGGGRNDGFIMPFNVGAVERELAMTLRLPIYGVDDRFERFGTKTGARRLFREEGVAHPPGFESLRSLPQLQEAIVRLREANPALRAVVAKHDDGVYGDGNVVVALDDLPAAGSPQERPALDARLRGLPPDWIDELQRRAGIVEEMVDGEDFHSPSVQVRILPGGGPRIISTHDQVLGGAQSQSFVGCRFPADERYCALIVEEARKVGDRLAREGAIGRFGIDFVVTRRRDGTWRAAALEINLREGGTSHPYGALWLLTDGGLDARGSRYRTPQGEERFYFATDRLQDDSYRGIPVERLLRHARERRILYDPDRRLGVVLHMLCKLEPDGHVGSVSIGDSREDADRRHQELVDLLEELSGA